jgi:hypothetical protein
MIPGRRISVHPGRYQCQQFPSVFYGFHRAGLHDLTKGLYSFVECGSFPVQAIRTLRLHYRGAFFIDFLMLYFSCQTERIKTLAEIAENTIFQIEKQPGGCINEKG